MSLSYPDMSRQVIAVSDPRTSLHLNQYQKYIANKGSKQATHKIFTSTSYSDSQISFSCPPPSLKHVVSRRVMVEATFKITAKDANGNPAAFQIGSNDAPRAFPLASVLQTLTVTLNNQNFSCNVSDVIHALLRYGADDQTFGKEYSITPSRQDFYQEYSDWNIYGSGANPLAQSGESTPSDLMMNRGGFTYRVTQGTQQNPTEVEITVTEPLFLSPLLFGERDAMGFAHVQTFDLQLTLGNLSRVWSSCNFNDDPNLAINSITVTQSKAPRAMFQYFTVNDLQPIPDKLQYPLYNIERFPIACNVVNPGAETTVTSTNITLSSIPKRFYVYARRRNSDLTFKTTDTFARIKNIRVQWSNQTGLFSSASEQDLYLMSVKNGLQMSWQQWSKYTGSVLAIQMGNDIGLGDYECSGVLGQYQLQMDVTFQNIGSNPVNYDLYIVTVSEGVVTFQANGMCVSSVAPLTRQDVINAKFSSRYDYERLKDWSSGYQGGSWMDTAKSLLKPALKCLADVAVKEGKKAIGLGAKVGGELVGGELVGGKRISRAQLKKMLHKK